MLWPALLHSWVWTHSITWVWTHSITWVRTRSTSRVPANTCSITWLRTRSITYYLPITGSNNRVVMVGFLNELIDLIWVIDVTTILFFILMTTCWLYVDFKIQRIFFSGGYFRRKKFSLGSYMIGSCTVSSCWWVFQAASGLAPSLGSVVLEGLTCSSCSCNLINI